MQITFSALDEAVIALYFGAVLLVGFLTARRQRKETVEYLLAGRSLTTPVFVMTLVSTWYGGILGVGEFSYRYGISNWVIQGVPYYFFAFLFAFLLAGRVRATNFATIPDKLHASYGKPTALLGAVLTFFLMTPAPYILMIAVLLQILTGWSLLACVLAGTLATTVYLYAGGFRSDVNTDVLEFFLMFLGFAVILPFAYVKYGGFAFLKANVPPLHLTWDGGNSMQFVIVWFFIASWTLVDPSFHQRCYAAKDPGVAKRGILWSILFWLLFDAMTATAGLYARAAIPRLDQPVLAYPALAEAVLPPVAKGLFYVGMLATIMSTLNTLMFVSATTLGRDLVWRIKQREESEVGWTKAGLFITGILSMGLALAIPSVIKLWYTIGTVIIPGLLVPLVTSYFPSLTVRPRYAFAAMATGWIISSAWLMAGWSQQLGGSQYYPLGIEPMYPGLMASIVIWAVGWGRRDGTNRSMK
ncbi:MAG: sodium:solute symporter family protein [Bacteroidota bacterium]